MSNALQKNTPLNSAVISFATSGDHLVIAGVAGKVIQVYRIMLVSAGTTAVTFKDDQTALSGAMSLTTNGQLNMPFDGLPLYESPAANGFNINNSLAIQLSGTIWYTQQ